jgi:hypothetical protein
MEGVRLAWAAAQAAWGREAARGREAAICRRRRRGEGGSRVGLDSERLAVLEEGEMRLPGTLTLRRTGMERRGELGLILGQAISHLALPARFFIVHAAIGVRVDPRRSNIS